MYPYELFLGIDLYSILMLAGIIVSMTFIRFQGDWRGHSAKLQNFVLMNTVAAVLLGYGSAVLFQAFYDFMETGTFQIARNTGSTFYGGLIGGAGMFILIYFVAGHFRFPDGYHKKHFREVSDLAAACITVAHGFGRLGCLMAGCCYGKRCDAWYGIEMAGLGYKVIPVQLFEALFLFVLAGIFLWRFKKGGRYLMPAYMMSYAVWRFIAELMRDDDRGATIVDFLTPSQLISVLLLSGGLLLLGIELFLDDRNGRRMAAAEIVTETAAETVAETPSESCSAETPAEAPVVDAVSVDDGDINTGDEGADA